MNSKRFLSIDFGRTFIKVVYLESKAEVLIVLDYEIKKISFNEENRGELVKFISEFLKKRSISAKEVCVTLSDPDSVIVKILTLPDLSKEELLEAVKWQLKDDLPYDINAGIVDWQIVKQFSDETGAKKIGVVGGVVKRSIVDQYLSIIGECGLIPFRVSSLYLNHLYLIQRLKKDSSVTAVLTVGSKESSLCIYKDNQLHFIRGLAFSLNKITQALTGVLQTGSGKVGLSLEQADEIIRAFGIPQEEQGLLQHNVQAIHVISLIRPFLETLLKEMKLTFNYFSSNFKEGSPSALYITGGGANLKNLDTYLVKDFNFKVSQLSLPECVNIKAIQKEKFEMDHNQLISSIGAALAKPENMDLLPLEIKTRKIELIQKSFLRTFTIILAGILLFSLAINNLQVIDYQKRLENAQGHLQSIQRIRILKQKIDEKEDLINKLQKGKIPDQGLLKELSNIIPENFILTDLIVDMHKHTLNLKGQISTSRNALEDLTRFMQKIKSSSFFTEVSLINSENKEGIEVFEIQCSLVQ